MQQYEKIEQALSKDRLNGYTTKNNFNCHALSLYQWNTQLSESLYPLLQMIEVVFRNSVHAAIAEQLADPNWLLNSNLLEHRDLVEVKKQEIRLRKSATTISVGKIISELNFGFWIGLLDAHYEMTFWRSKIIKRAFPNMLPRERMRHNLSSHFNKIRKLRNRVFHYEPIWYWQDLKSQHDDILLAIKWIEPAVLELLSTDRFYAIHEQGPQARAVEYGSK